MTPADRLETVRRGLAAVRHLAAARHAALPSPAHPDPDRLRAVRELRSVADRLAGAVGEGGQEPWPVEVLDAALWMEFAPDEVAWLADLASDAGAGTPYREGPPAAPHGPALRALTELLARYEQGEFPPPPPPELPGAGA